MVGIASAEMTNMEENDQASVSSEASTLWHTASSHKSTKDQESLAGSQKSKPVKGDSFADLYQFARKRIPSLSVVPTPKPISKSIANPIPSARSVSLPTGNGIGNGPTLEQPKPDRPNALSLESRNAAEAKISKQKIHGLEIELDLCYAELAKLKAKLKRMSAEQPKSKAVNNEVPGVQMQKKIQEKEALIAELDKNLKNEQGQCQFFMVQHQQTVVHRDELNAKYKEKSAEADKFRNEVERLQKIIDRISDQKQSLEGAVHFVLPAKREKLPKDVFACVECYNRNETCDNATTCKLCHDNNYKCRRLRCSLQHVLKRPCGPVCVHRHSQNGWLIQEQPRPEW